jgi:acyl-CoA synthetase (NDP forming)
VVVKAGRTGAGRRAASSHTAAMAAGEAAVGALFHQAEVIRAGTLEEMFDVAAVLAAQPAFGPLVLAGLGETTVEVLGDVAVRLTPLSSTDVDQMLRSLRSYRLLTGYRHLPSLDVAAFAELLHRVSAIVEDIPQIAELDLNPVFVRQHGAVVADTRIRLTR